MECSEEFTQFNFDLSEYEDLIGRRLPQYIITRNRFSFLVMGFIGKGVA
ncbi:MAG: Rha family transcriptional regulator [Flavobacteriales bacterium AspAUS03]